MEYTDLCRQVKVAAIEHMLSGGNDSLVYAAEIRQPHDHLSSTTLLYVHPEGGPFVRKIMKIKYSNK